MKELAARVEAALGARPVEWTPRAGGYSTADRFTVTLDDGRRVFVKSAEAPHLAAWLRREHEVYAHLNASFMPELIAFDDDGLRPLLVLEDLSHADWEPRWTPERIETLRRALRELNACEPPAATSRLEDARPGWFTRWQQVAEDPEPFLSLGLRARSWLDRHLHELIELSSPQHTHGDDLLHLDVRSDNVCFVDGRAVLVDWNWVTIANGALDIAGWLPSAHLEGAPPPWELLPAEPRFAALLSGIWASVAGLPPPETAPTVRAFQARQLAVTLDWFDREL